MSTAENGYGRPSRRSHRAEARHHDIDTRGDADERARWSRRPRRPRPRLPGAGALGGSRACGCGIRPHGRQRQERASDGPRCAGEENVRRGYQRGGCYSFAVLSASPWPLALAPVSTPAWAWAWHLQFRGVWCERTTTSPESSRWNRRAPDSPDRTAALEAVSHVRHDPEETGERLDILTTAFSNLFMPRCRTLFSASPVVAQGRPRSGGAARDSKVIGSNRRLRADRSRSAASFPSGAAGIGRSSPGVASSLRDDVLHREPQVEIGLAGISGFHARPRHGLELRHSNRQRAVASIEAWIWSRVALANLRYRVGKSVETVLVELARVE